MRMVRMCVKIGTLKLNTTTRSGRVNHHKTIIGGRIARTTRIERARL